MRKVLGTAMQNFDIVIIGAGISGIGTAFHLQKKCPEKSYVILEGRDALGGTWDLFRYPGIRSDSSMLTMAYSFKPWHDTKITGKGEAILNYVRETAAENNIEQHIRYSQKATQATWSSEHSTWTIQTQSGETYECNFLLNCAGYYSYESGYSPDFKGLESFGGTVIHPQAWPEDFDYSNKKIVVIGSGATAVTLVPEMAKEAKHVTMLQRSPSYVYPVPDEDPVANRIRKFLPPKLAYRLLRWRSIASGQKLYNETRKNPEQVKTMMLDIVREELPKDYDVAKHFSPNYNPWDQRVCFVPDGDLFKAIREGTASVVTDHIEHFTETGIVLTSGQILEADIVVTATGLKLEVMGGIDYSVDNKAIDFADTIIYKGMMCSEVPNMIWMFGYINASWTLRVDMTADYVCRLLNHMDDNKYKVCTARFNPLEANNATDPWIKDFSSGYMQRSMHLMPKQAKSEPWVNTQDYRQDKRLIERSPVEDEMLFFES